MALIQVHLHSVASICLAPKNSTFKKRKQGSQHRFWTALVQVFKQSKNVYILEETFFHTLDSEVEKTLKVHLSFSDVTAKPGAKVAQKQASKSAAKKVSHLLHRHGLVHLLRFYLVFYLLQLTD